MRLHGKGNSKLPWRKAGQPSHLVDVVDSNQWVFKKQVPLLTDLALFGELDAVGKEVQHNLPESVWVADHVLVQWFVL